MESIMKLHKWPAPHQIFCVSMYVIWTHAFLFYEMGYYPLFSLFGSSKCLQFYQWEPCQPGFFDVLKCPHHSWNSSLFNGMKKMSQAHLALSLQPPQEGLPHPALVWTPNAGVSSSSYPEAALGCLHISTPPAASSYEHSLHLLSFYTMNQNLSSSPAIPQHLHHGYLFALLRLPSIGNT